MLAPSNRRPGTHVNIDELRQQVESAIALFTLVDERNLSFCQGLLDSLKAIERKHLERRADMVRLEEGVERLTQENQQLRAMLQSLVLAAGGGRHRKLDEVRTLLERHVGRLTQSGSRRSEPDPGEPVTDGDATDQPDSAFSVPDASIGEIVARIGRTSATAAEKSAPTTPLSAEPETQPSVQTG